MSNRPDRPAGEGARHHDEAGDDEELSGEPVRAVPDLFVRQRPRRPDADEEVARDLAEQVPDHDEEDAEPDEDAPICESSPACFAARRMRTSRSSIRPSTVTFKTPQARRNGSISKPRGEMRGSTRKMQPHHGHDDREEERAPELRQPAVDLAGGVPVRRHRIRQARIRASDDREPREDEQESENVRQPLHAAPPSGLSTRKRSASVEATSSKTRRIERVDDPLSAPLRADEVGGLEDAVVMRQRGHRDRKLLGDLAGAARAALQESEDPPPVRIGEGAKDLLGAKHLIFSLPSKYTAEAQREVSRRI